MNSVHGNMFAALVVALACCSGSASAQQTSALDDYLSTSQPAPSAGDGVAAMDDTQLPASASQGALVIGHADPAATVAVDARVVRVSADGGFVFGIGRDASGDVVVTVQQPGTGAVEHRVAVTPRDWPVERIDGVPPKTVNPPPAIAARIAREQARVVAQRERDDARDDYEQAFIWPVHGRISGRFGNARVYNGVQVWDGSRLIGGPQGRRLEFSR